MEEYDYTGNELQSAGEAETEQIERQKSTNFENGFTKVENKLFFRGRYLSQDARWVYVTLCHFRNGKTQLCNPNLDTLMERTDLRREDLCNALSELEHFHWIGKKPKRFGGSTSYTIGWPVVPEYDGGERVGLAADQTRPTKEEADRWQQWLKDKKPKKRKWSDIVNKDVKDDVNEIENRSGATIREEDIPF